jgi:required for meiotic nuclear division protein 1
MVLLSDNEAPQSNAPAPQPNAPAPQESDRELRLTPTVPYPRWPEQCQVVARAWLLGERLVLKTLEATDPLSTNPLMIRAGENGCAVLLRYGVLVLFNLSAMEEAAFIEKLRPFIKDPIAVPEAVSEQLQLRFQLEVKERLEKDVLWLRDSSVERLQIVAEALAKSLVLEYYEAEVSRLFEQIKPFTEAIQSDSGKSPKERELLRYIGGTLLIQQRMVGIVEVGDKPDPIWDYPELDRLYLRLEDEYELRERLLTLESKLSLVSKTVETTLGMLQRDSSHRVEWYIVILIVVEIFLSVYDIWIKP